MNKNCLSESDFRKIISDKRYFSYTNEENLMKTRTSRQLHSTSLRIKRHDNRLGTERDSLKYLSITDSELKIVCFFNFFNEIFTNYCYY